MLGRTGYPARYSSHYPYSVAVKDVSLDRIPISRHPQQHRDDVFRNLLRCAFCRIRLYFRRYDLDHRRMVKRRQVWNECPCHDRCSITATNRPVARDWGKNLREMEVDLDMEAKLQEMPSPKSKDVTPPSTAHSEATETPTRRDLIERYGKYALVAAPLLVFASKAHAIHSAP